MNERICVPSRSWNVSYSCIITSFPYFSTSDIYHHLGDIKLNCWWKLRVSMMPTLVSLVALQVVIMTTCSVTSDAKVGIMTHLTSQCILPMQIPMNLTLCNVKLNHYKPYACIGLLCFISRFKIQTYLDDVSNNYFESENSYSEITTVYWHSSCFTTEGIISKLIVAFPGRNIMTIVIVLLFQ